MKTLRVSLTALGLTALLAGSTWAQRPVRPGAVDAKLIPDAVKEKLNLTADQKGKVTSLEKEFDAKASEVKDLRDKLSKDRTRELRKELEEKEKAFADLRRELEAKLSAVLDDAQKRILAAGARIGVGPKGILGRPIASSGDLITKETEEKLKLSAEQQKTVAALKKEFHDKTAGAREKLIEDQKKAIADKNREGAKTAADGLRELATGERKVREELEGKLKAVLNDEQKKILQEGGRPSIDVRPIGLPGAAAGVLNPAVQFQLKLTAAQKEKLEGLIKELEKKARDLLDDDQKKKLDEFETRRTRPKPGGAVRPRVRPAPTAFRQDWAILSREFN